MFTAAQQRPQSSDDMITYLDTRFEVTSEGNHTYYRVISDYTQNLAVYELSQYFKSGSIQLKGKISNKYLRTYEGVFVSYYENGSKKSLTNYKDNQPIGSFYTW